MDTRDTVNVTSSGITEASYCDFDATLLGQLLSECQSCGVLFYLYAVKRLEE